MSEQEQRCGTCKWWETFVDGRPQCGVPTPFWSYGRPSRTLENEGRYCDTWEPR